MNVPVGDSRIKRTPPTVNVVEAAHVVKNIAWLWLATYVYGYTIYHLECDNEINDVAFLCW